MKIATICCCLFLTIHSSIAQAYQNKRGAKSTPQQDKILVAKVDSLSEKLSDTLEELRKLRKQNIELSEKVNQLQSAEIEKQTSSGSLSTFLIQIVSLVLVAGFAILGTIFFLRRRRRRRRIYTEESMPTPNTDISYRLDKLYTRVTHIEDKQRQIDEVLKLHERKIDQVRTPLFPQIPTERIPASEIPESLLAKSKVSTLSPVQELVSAYNAALRNPNDRTNFRDTYRFSRIGVPNAMERRRDSNLTPIFQTAADGDYYAVEFGEQTGNRFPIVPRFDLTLQQSNYVPGAIGLVFRCLGFDPNKRYRNFTLIRPAYFTRTSGETWNLVETGELQVGEGE